MVVKSARRYITALDKILKSQHNDITTKIVEFNDDNIEYIMLNFFIDSKQCFVAAYDYDDIVEYHVDGIDGVIEYKIGDNETHKHSIYTILNRINDLIVKLEEENKTSVESIKDTIIADDNIAYQTAKVTKTKHSVIDVMQCLMCSADREGNRCGGKQWCKQTWKRYDAIVNPEWHHVSLATLANIDFDMLDEKRKVYLSFYKKWQEARKNLRKCSCGSSYERCCRVFRRSLTIALGEKKISKSLVDYFDRQISMVNVECGVWSSMVEVAMGQHDSRKYNRATLRY